MNVLIVFKLPDGVCYSCPLASLLDMPKAKSEHNYMLNKREYRVLSVTESLSQNGGNEQLLDVLQLAADGNEPPAKSIGSILAGNDPTPGGIVSAPDKVLLVRLEEVKSSRRSAMRSLGITDLGSVLPVSAPGRKQKPDGNSKK